MRPRRRLRRAACALLSLSALASFGAAGWSAREAGTLALVETVLPEEMSTTALALHIDALLAETVDAAWLGAEIDAALTADPVDWTRLDALSALAETRRVAPPPETARRLAAAQAARPSAARACADGAFGAAPPDHPAAIGCYAAVALTPVVGETKDLAVEAGRGLRGDPVDWAMVGLASAGLGAAALGPASLPARYAAATVKAARRLGWLSAGLAAEIAAAARKAAGGGRLDPGALAPLRGPAAALGEIAVSAGPVAAARALRHVDRLDDIRRVARVSAATGARPGPALEALGLARIFRPVARIGRAGLKVWALAGAALAQLVLAALAAAQWGAGRALRA